MRQRLDVHGGQGLLATHGDPVVARFDIAAHGPKLHDGHAQKSGVDAVHGEGASGKRAADEKGARLDAVAHRRVLAGMERRERHALDLDERGAGAGHARAHGVEHVRQILDLGLAGGVLDGRVALGGHGSHEHVLRGAHRGELEVHVGAAQAVRRRGGQNAVIHVERNAQGLQAHQVHVDLAGADLAAAGHGHPRLAEAPDKRPQHRDGGAHLRDELVGRLAAVDVGSVYAQGMPLAHHGGAQAREHLAHKFDIGNERHVVQDRLPLPQNGRGHELQGRVLGAGDAHVAFEGMVSPNDDDFLVHF